MATSSRSSSLQVVRTAAVVATSVLVGRQVVQAWHGLGQALQLQQEQPLGLLTAR